MSSASVVDWRLLAQASPQAHELGAVEARLLARTLAACDVVQDRDGRVADIERRTQDILQTVWPKDPLSGFGLHSSPGAFLVARVAVDLVPARGSLRSEPFDLEALLQNLEELGVEPTTAATVVMPWDGAPDDFSPAGSAMPEVSDSSSSSGDVLPHPLRLNGAAPAVAMEPEAREGPGQALQIPIVRQAKPGGEGDDVVIEIPFASLRVSVPPGQG